MIINRQEVIQKSLADGEVPLAQAYLIQRSSSEGDVSQVRDGAGGITACRRYLQVTGVHAPLSDVTYDSLRKVGVGLVMKALSDKNLKSAMSLIHQLVDN